MLSFNLSSRSAKVNYYPADLQRFFPFPKKESQFKSFGFLRDLFFLLYGSVRDARFSQASKLIIKIWIAVRQEYKNSQKSDPNIVNKREKLADKVYQTIIELGGAYIKIGQYIASREDLIPAEYVKKLSKLSDDAPALDFSEIREITESELGKSLEELFAEVEQSPTASASIAQVHRAKTHDGKEVILKIQRPNLAELFQRDLSLIRAYGAFFERYTEWGQNRYLVEVCDQMGEVLFEEIDFEREALSAQRMKLSLCQDHPELLIPEIHVEYLSRKVLVMEYIEGRRITDREAIREAGLTEKWICDKLIAIFFDQFFKHCFFHADPHPGNILITKQGKIVLLDFGMTYRISQSIKENFQRAIIGLVGGDTDELIKCMYQMDLLRPNIKNIAAVKSLIDNVVYKYYGGSKLQEINFASIKDEVNEIIANSPIRMPASLIYIFRGAEILEGIVRGFQPKFSLIDTIRPYTRDWFLESEKNSLLKAAIKILFDNELIGEEAMQIFSLPLKANNILGKVERGELQVPINLSPLESRISKIEHITQGIALMFVGTICASVSFRGWEIGVFPEWFLIGGGGLATFLFGWGGKKILSP